MCDNLFYSENAKLVIAYKNEYYVPNYVSEEVSAAIESSNSFTSMPKFIATRKYKEYD